MATQMFMKIDTVEGESQDARHEGWIEISSFSWGITNMGSGSRGKGSGSGTCDIQDFTITKEIDKSTSALMLKCANGTHFDEAKIVGYKAGGDDPVPYLNFKFKQVYISSYQTGGQGNGDLPFETISFNFAEVEEEYKLQTEKGATGAGSRFGWNVPKGIAT
jgi:type VI secretion system secreted protein Hcp